MNVEERINALTFICTAEGRTPMFKDLPTIEHEGRIYGIVSHVTHAIRDIYSAYAVRLDDETNGYRVPLYAISWTADSPEDIDMEDYEDVQYLNDSYDIIRGTV